MRKLLFIVTVLFALASPRHTVAQVNTDQLLQIGRNALYFEDYVLSIQYFNQIIAAKPYLAQPYFYRALAKYNLDDFSGAIDDASAAIDRNPFLTDAYELRGIALQSVGKPELAVADYDKVLEMLPLSRGILFNKALAQEEMGADSLALITYTDIIDRHPSYDLAYIGRAKLLLSMADTLAARADIDTALVLNPNSANAYIMHADIVVSSDADYPRAIADMDMAIKLQPRMASLFINRAFLRYKSDDYFGAMSDYDYALQLDPLNATALFNRSLLRSEVRDFNGALADLSTVLRLRPTDYRALYNRALIYRELQKYSEAVEDINKIIEAFPDLAAPYFIRFDLRQSMGDRNAYRDYDRSIALGKKKVRTSHPSSSTSYSSPSIAELFSTGSSSDDTEISQEAVAARFSELLTVNTESELQPGYSSSSTNIRGRVQDRNISIELEPIFVVTYYTSPTELKPTGEYLKEVSDINATHALDYQLQVTNREVAISDTLEIQRHFRAIDYYISYLSNHSPRAIDYFALGMSRSTLRQYQQALADFERAVAVAPDFALAHYMIGVTRYHLAGQQSTTPSSPAETSERRIMLSSAIQSFQRALELSPAMALAYYDMGVIYADMQDPTSAISAFTHAIELKPDFGEAFFNRGYVYFQLGNHAAGSADLSTAGQLGIAPSYSLLKRMAR